MKILFYLENYVAGGVDTVIANTLSLWPEPADRVVLLCNPSHAGLELLRKRAGRVLEERPLPALPIPELYLRYLPRDGFRRGLLLVFFKIFWYYGRYPLFLWNVARIAACFRRERPDAVLIHNGGYPGADTARAAACAALAAGVERAFMVVHNLATRPALPRLPFEFLVDRAVDRSVRIVCVSANSAEVLGRNRFIRQKPIILRNGTLDVASSSRAEGRRLRDELRFPEDRVVLGMVGAFDEHKGHQDLLAALETLKRDGRLSGAACLVFGRGDARQTEAVRRGVEVRGLGDVVFLRGFREDVHRIYSAFDVFLQPSRDFESFPMTVLEAMCAAVPVVATDVGGVTEMVEDGVTGIIVPPNDPGALASALAGLIADRSLRARMGRAGRLSFERNFSAERMARDYRELVADERPSSTGRPVER